MRRVDEGADGVHREGGVRKVVEAAGEARRVVAGRVEDSRGLGGMSAKGSGPALSDGVRATEETRISANAREASGAGEVD